MTSSVIDLTEINAVINDIEIFGLDDSLFLDAVKEICNSSNFLLIEEHIYSDTIKSVDKVNSLRLVGTPIYISLSQIKENLKSEFFQNILRIFLNSISKEGFDVVGATIKQLLPQIIGCIHYVAKEERCIYTTAIELYLRDNQKFYKPEEFYPKLLEYYCDNLIIKCSHRKKKKCSMSMQQLYSSLNSLEGKHILERDSETNEYKYIRW